MIYYKIGYRTIGPFRSASGYRVYMFYDDEFWLVDDLNKNMRLSVEHCEVTPKYVKVI